MRVARAFANMLRAAWHDPLWALTAVVTMPFLAFWPVVGGAVLVLLVGFAGVGLASWLTPPDSLWNEAAHAGVVLVMAALAWRMLTAPLLPASCFALPWRAAIDPKGENARVAGRARTAFGPVHCLDPFGLSGHKPASCNPLAGIDPYGLDIAEALVFDAPGRGRRTDATRGAPAVARRACQPAPGRAVWDWREARSTGDAG